MSRLRSRRARAAAATSLAALIAACTGPVAAQAADAPLRFTGISAEGKRVWDINWLGATADGTTLVGTHARESGSYDGRDSRVVSRNVTTGVTTELTGAGHVLLGTSDDQRRLLIRTKVSHVAADTNGKMDLYVLDRREDRWVLLSANADGSAIGTTFYESIEIGQMATYFFSPVISGSGAVAQYTVSTGVLGEDESTRETRRVDLATGAVTVVSTSTKSEVGAVLDDAGRVVVRDGAIYRDGVKKIDLRGDLRWLKVSPDGSYAAAWSWNEERVYGFDLITGETGSLPLPNYNGGRRYPVIKAVENGGRSVLVNDLIDTSDGERIIYARLARSGAVDVLGEVPVSDWEWLGDEIQNVRLGGINGGVSAGGQFAFTGLVLAKLGSAPLPGTEPTAPSITAASDYLFPGSAYCTRRTWWGMAYYSKPTITLAVKRQRADLRRAVSFTGDVFRTTTGQRTQSVTLTPGKPVELDNIGANGGFKVEGTVRFSDGSSLAGASITPTHGSPACSQFVPVTWW